MSSSLRSLSDPGPQDIPNAHDFRFGLVVSRWHDDITDAMSTAAMETLLRYGAREESIFRVDVPGTYELPVGARLLSGRQKLDAIICIGCVIKGETDHNAYISHAVAQGLIQFSLMSGIPAIFGVLTPDTPEQALDRAGGAHGNKGVEAALTAIQMAALRKNQKDTGSSIGFGNPA